jgi:hypothetical protein
VTVGGLTLTGSQRDQLHADAAGGSDGEHHGGGRDDHLGHYGQQQDLRRDDGGDDQLEQRGVERRAGGTTANVKLSTNGYTASFASAGVANGIGVTVGGLTH